VSLLEDVTALGAGRRRVACTIAVILSTLDKETGAELQTLLTAKDAAGEHAHAGVHIARALTARGHRVNGHTVQRHRNRECSCNQS
jgi:hypothetical protein